MLSNMFKTAWRTSMRHKQFTFLNILGLSIGITTCLMIGLYVQDEMSYDNFHKNKGRIYRINQSAIWGSDWEQQMPGTGPNVAIALRTDIPEFEQVTKVLAPEPFAVSYRQEDKAVISFLEDNFLVVEENFLNVFSFEMIEGNFSTALAEPFKIVLTEKMATKYFGKENAIGKTFHMKGTILEGASEKKEQWVPFEVTAVLKNVPGNSHIKFDMLTSMSSYQDIKSMESAWVWTGFANYGLVKEGTDIDALTAKMQAIPPKWAAGTLNRVFSQTFEELADSGKSWRLFLQPIENIYLNQTIGNFIGPNGNVRYITIFSVVGLIILTLSCINFMNLSTARSSNRAKEVGIRKVLGSHRKALIHQFIFESMLYTLASTIIAIVATELFISSFNDIAQKELSLYTYLTNIKFLSIITVFALSLGFIAGIYPAFYLSSFKPASILKGKLSTSMKGKNLRNALVIFQFTASIALIISTLFVHKQLSYTTNFNVGYDREHVLQLHNIGRLETQVGAIKNTLANNPAVKIVGQSHEVPPNIMRGDIIKSEDVNAGEVRVTRMKSDEDYINLLDIKWLAGRNFEKTMASDKNSKVILNAAAVKALGFGIESDYENDSPLGKMVTRFGAKFEIIGVVDNFHFNSLKNEVMPLIIYHIDNPNLPDSGTSPSFLSLRLNAQAVNSGDDLQRLISEIESDISTIDSSFPFEYSFMDQSFENSFRNEQKMGKVLNIFTVMAVIIACLGLYGLAAFSAEQRTKELGIRKVLGAKTMHLVMLFSSEFTRLVILSLLIGTPLAYYFVRSWLSDFAYKTPIDIWVFVLAGISALVISWSTVGFQSLKTARLNPVDALKDE
jgi:putative ABC transport system permease protein